MNTLRENLTALSNAHRGNLVEWVTERVIHGYCRPGDTAVDVGANYGAHTFTMCQRVGLQGRVIAYEANPAVAANLVQWTTWRKNLTVVQRALADFQGEANFYVADLTGLSSLNANELERRGKPVEKTISVPVDTLDTNLDECGVESLRLIKIDVEGAELAVLRGATATLERYSPVIVVEMAAAALMRREPDAYARFQRETLADRYLLMSVVGEIVDEAPVASDYQFVLVPKADRAVVDRITALVRASCQRFFSEGLQDWTPYLKFQKR